MRPVAWQPPTALATSEQAVVSRIRRAKLFVFLRRQRAAIFSVDFQNELATLYKDSPVGQPPIPPAQLALATILQAYTGVSDDEVIEATVMDRRWQLVLDCLDEPDPPFSKGTLIAFRTLLIAHDMDRRLIEQTVAIADQSHEFGERQLRAALDSSPLWGAGRVEDTYNLVGHALKKALGVIARQQGWELAEVASAMGVPVLGGPSLKAALDLDWDDPAARATALVTLLAALETVEEWVAAHVLLPPAPLDQTGMIVETSLATARQVVAQDVESGVDGAPALRHGVAKDRRISVEDAQMRHGRKSRSQLIDGYKRHVLRDLDRSVIRAVAVTPANVPEATATDAIVADLARQAITLVEVHLDRAYLSSVLVRDRRPDLAIYCKAWPVRNRLGFPKTEFTWDWTTQTITCPNGVLIPFQPGHTVHFPEEDCARCRLRERCTTSASGRSVTIHPDEKLLAELRERQTTPAGRATLRERVRVEHSLAHIGHWQGDRARYRGVRKNLFDLRRAAVVHNLHVIARFPHQSQAA
jgi:IS5 family transposase